MHFIKKTCNCICYSHHKCIELWIETNSVCPICKKPLLFPQTKLNKNKTLTQIGREPKNNCGEIITTYVFLSGIVCIMVLLGNIIH